MKPQATYFFIIMCTLLLSMMSFDAKSQHLRELKPLAHHDFECLQSLDCAQNSTSLTDKGWAFIPDHTVEPLTREFTASMKSDDVRLQAKYDQEGNLIRARYTRYNVALPKCLLIHLSLDHYSEWQISESEFIIKDFNPSTAQYKVKLINENAETLEEFDYQMITELHERYEGQAEFCLLN
jgi:hypothetical protein